MKTEEQVVEDFEYSEEEPRLRKVWLALYLWAFMILVLVFTDPSVVHKGLLLSSFHLLYLWGQKVQSWLFNIY